jgi:hypothetical protein
VFSKKFSYESKLSTMIFSCPPEQLSVLFKVSEKQRQNANFPKGMEKSACGGETTPELSLVHESCSLSIQIKSQRNRG